MKQLEVQPSIDVVTRGDVPHRAREYAIGKFGAVVQWSPVRVRHVHAVLTRTHHRDATHQVIAEVNLDVAGRLVRAQVAAGSHREAIDLACDRLRRKLSELQHRPGRPTGRRRAHRPAYPRVIGGQVTRRKTWVPVPETVAEAIDELELMDRDFHLFHDAQSDVDSVVYRDDGGYRITRADSRVTEPQGIAVDEWPAPKLPLQAAIGVMDICDAPFVFYADPDTGRGQLLYRRYDGGYGLIAAAG